MMKTPEEIKMGLECCTSRDCGGYKCPYFNEKSCSTAKAADAIAYIQQLEEDNAQLNRCIENMTDKLNAMNDEVAKWQAERDAAADAMPRWISVEERLPEEGQMVAFIRSCNNVSVYVGVLTNIGKNGGVMFSHREGRYTSNCYAKYWMPLPEPPKEE